MAKNHFYPSCQTVVLLCGGRKGCRGGSVDLRAAFMLIFFAFSWSRGYLCLLAGTHLPLHVFLPSKANWLFRMLKRPIYAVAFAPDILEAISCITYAIAATNGKYNTFSHFYLGFDKSKCETASSLLSWFFFAALFRWKGLKEHQN